MGGKWSGGKKGMPEDVEGYRRRVGLQSVGWSGRRRGGRLIDKDLNQPSPVRRVPLEEGKDDAV